MKTLLLSLWIALCALVSPVGAEPVVVVSADSAVGSLSQEAVINIFLGRYRRLPTGEAAQPIDQPEASALRAEFYRKLVNKEVSDINAYWSRLIFSGRTSPPLQASSAAEVTALLLTRPGAVAYVERSQVDKRLRVVLAFPR